MKPVNLVKLSKHLSFLLRHRPEAVGLSLDAQGWASVGELLSKVTAYPLTHELLDVVVETNDKQRFSFSEDGRFIRANQGHTIAIDLALKPLIPPEILLHGTAVRFMVSIAANGLSKMKRHHVHLTESKAVAQSVGGRYGKVIILEIAARKMHQDGFRFYKTANNVWLVEHVPFSYIKTL
jgi:putative RNA 2'-phosphotransferase